MAFKQHTFEDVPKLGCVIVSQHAQERASRDNITEAMFKDALYTGKHVPDGTESVLVDKGPIRIVVLLKPKMNRPARLAVSAFRKRPHKRIRG